MEIAPDKSGVTAHPASYAHAKEDIEKLIQKHKLVMYSRSDCKYSIKAKALFDKYKDRIHDYQIIEVDQLPNGQALKEELGRMTGAATTPRIFLKGKFIGGADDVEKLEQEGKLQSMLQEAGALNA